MGHRRLIPVESKDPLRTVRLLLKSIWDQVGLDGLYLPIWQDKKPPKSTLITSQDSLERADPFAPVMHRNSACQAADIIRNSPDRKFGFVFRPCELRTFHTLLEKLMLDPRNEIFISSDCLATFPPEDFDWRLEESEDRDSMTQTALYFAAQGGILPSRYRNCCQFCDKPFPERTDISIELLGIPTHEYIILNIQKSALVNLIELTDFRDQPVPPEITQRREKMLSRLADWRQKAQAYTSAHLDKNQKTVAGLINHLKECSFCRKWIREKCPLFEADWIREDSRTDPIIIERWLQNCGGCGMCEVDCPEGYPLFRSILFISQSLGTH